jgi:hypothetical protein
MAGSGKNRRDTIGGKIKKLVGLNKIEEPSPGKKAAENRAMGEAIASELDSVDFLHSEYKGRTEEDSPQMLYKKISVISRVLRNSPTICDNIAGMDKILLYAAQAFSNAIKNNDYNKAIWAKNALCAGVIYLRDNIPADKEDVKDELLAERIKYMQNYKTIIQLYEKADAKEKAVNEYDRILKEKHKTYDPSVKEIQAMKDTPEGIAMLGKLKLNEITPDSLSDEERKVLDKIRETAMQAHNIYLTSSSRTAAQIDYETAIEQAADVRTLLVNKPNVFNRELTALHALAMEDQIKSIAKSFSEAAAMVDSVTKADAMLKEVMNGADAQKVYHNAVSFMEKVLNGNTNEDADAIREGNRMAKRANEAELARKQAAEEAQKEMNMLGEQIKNIDIAGAFDIDFSNVENTDENANENEDELSNMNFNYNS